MIYAGTGAAGQFTFKARPAAPWFPARASACPAQASARPAGRTVGRTRRSDRRVSAARPRGSSQRTGPYRAEFITARPHH
eukprot:366077-Hanusia_phi.AAC.1